MNDKELEKKRYDKKNSKYFFKSNIDLINFPVGIDSMPEIQKAPYIEYHKLIKNYSSKNKSVLEIASGSGTHSKTILESKAFLTATDISLQSLKILKMRFSDFENLEIQVSDMENLKFSDNSFDIVLSAGSLSYGNNIMVMNNIYRVLKPGGVFICVDSLDENFIYKANRFVHFLRGNRTLSTLKRMPNLKTLDMYRSKFSSFSIKYYGSIIWLSPLLSKLIGYKNTLRFINYFDKLIKVRNSAFKFVMTVKK